MSIPGAIMRKRMRVAAAAAAVLFSVLLVVVGRSRPALALRGGLTRLIAPVAGAGSRFGHYFTGIPASRVRDLEDAERGLASCAAERAVLREENASLASSLGLKAASASRLSAARVISYTQIMGRETLVIDAGEDRGIAAGDIVIDQNQLLVGVVAESALSTATVSVASNAGIKFSGELVPLGDKVLVSGIGGRTFALELIPYDTPLLDGDVVRWILEDRRMSPPIFAGRVVRSGAASGGAFKTGRASLIADPARLDMIFVLSSP